MNMTMIESQEFEINKLKQNLRDKIMLIGYVEDTKTIILGATDNLKDEAVEMLEHYINHDGYINILAEVYTKHLSQEQFWMMATINLMGRLLEVKK